MPPPLRARGGSLSGRQAASDVRLQWFGDRVAANIRLGMSIRLRLAAQMLRDRTVLNISRPVRKFKGPRSGRVQVDPSSRSKPGEFPKADTTRLMKDIFWDMRGPLRAIVGTTLDYGLRLETRMDRSFLVRTMNQFFPTFQRIMTSGPRLPGQDL